MDNDSQPKEQILDALKFISQTHRAMFEQRLQRATKLIFSTITFYLLGVGARFGVQTSPSMDTALHQPMVRFVIWVLFLGLAVFAAIALRNSGRADLVNRRIAERAENGIIDILHANGVQILPSTERHSNPNSLDLMWKAMIILFFAVGSAAIITFA